MKNPQKNHSHNTILNKMLPRRGQRDFLPIQSSKVFSDLYFFELDPLVVLYTAVSTTE